MISAYSLGKIADLAEVEDFVAGCRDAHYSRHDPKTAEKLVKIVNQIHELRYETISSFHLTGAEQTSVLDGKNIEAIKQVRTRLGCDLRMARDIVEFWKQHKKG